MNTLLALLLSTTILSGLNPAVLNPLLPAPGALLESAQGIDPQACIGVWLQLSDTLVTEGYARHGGIAWQGTMPTMIESAIAAEACPALLDAARRLNGGGCHFDRELELTRQAAAHSDAMYRQCQDRFPDNFDRMCMSYYANDQQVSQRHMYMQELRAWLLWCAQL